MSIQPARRTAILLSLIILMILLNCFHTKAQVMRPVTIPLSLFSPSPVITGMGSAASSIPIEDSFNFYYNPAQLGLSSKNLNISAGFYTSPVMITPFSKENVLTSYAIQAGYDLNKVTGIPIRAGIGFMHQENNFTSSLKSSLINEIDSIYQSANNFAFGLAYNTYFADISLGLSIRDYNTIITPIYIFFSPNRAEIDAKKEDVGALAMDIGLLIDFPILKSLEITKDMDYHLNASIGYSLSDLGSEVKYYNRPYKLPRTERIGYGISMGLRHKLYGRSISLVKIDWTSEAKDLLVYIDTSEYNGKYQDIISDINIIDNVFLLQSKRGGAISQYGLRMSLAEIVELYYGSSFDLKSHGFSAGLNGIFKLISDPSDNNVFSFIADHIDVKFTYSSVNFDKGSSIYHYDRIYRGVNLSLFGF